MTLVMYNKSEVKPVGKKRFKVINPKNKKKYNIDFLIVTGACKSLLSLRASEHLQLLTINKQNILAMDCNAVETGLFTKEDCLSLHKDIFSGEGKLEGQLHLEIDQTVPAGQLSTRRRVLIALKEPLKQELDRLSNIGVIQRVDTPTSRQL